MMTLQQSLDQILPKISSTEFKENLGSANEVSFYVFDYDPKEEIKVREYITSLTNKINQNYALDFHIKLFDLYDLILNYYLKYYLNYIDYYMKTEESSRC